MSLKSVAVVGLGSIGRRHLRLLRRFRPDLKLFAVRSGHGGACPEEELVDATVSSIGDAIRIGVEAAIVASPSPFHIPQAIELASSGVSLLIEKPLSDGCQDLARLQRVVHQNNVVVLIGYMFRYDQAARLFKEKLESDLVGSVLSASIECRSYLPDWRPERDYRESASAQRKLGGGVLLELSHELDYANWFFGPMRYLQASFGSSKSLGIDVEESVDLLLESNSGVSIQAHLDFHSRFPRRLCAVQGVRGELYWDAIANEVGWKLIMQSAHKETLDIDHEEKYLQQLKHFFDCLEHNAKPIVSLEEGKTVLQLIAAARYAQRNGRRVHL